MRAWKEKEKRREDTYLYKMKGKEKRKRTKWEEKNGRYGEGWRDEKNKRVGMRGEELKQTESGREKWRNKDRSEDERWRHKRMSRVGRRGWRKNLQNGVIQGDSGSPVTVCKRARQGRQHGRITRHHPTILPHKCQGIWCAIHRTLHPVLIHVQLPRWCAM